MTKPNPLSVFDGKAISYTYEAPNQRVANQSDNPSVRYTAHDDENEWMWT